MVESVVRGRGTVRQSLPEEMLLERSPKKGKGVSGSVRQESAPP